MKIALTDIETTGLVPNFNEIIEIACVIFDDVTFEIDKTFEAKVKILHHERFDPKALEVNGYNDDEWRNARQLHDVLKEYGEITKGAKFCSQNIIFDWGFLMASDSVYLNFDRHKIELSSLAYAKIPHDKVTNYSLKTICTYLRIPPEPKQHRALNGAMKAYEVFKKLMEK